MNCDKCGRSAVIFIRYSGSHLCSSHFRDFVERRVKNELRREGEKLALELAEELVPGTKARMRSGRATSG